MVWTSVVSYAFHYDAESMDHGFYTKSGSVRALPFLSIQFLGVRKEIQPVWEIFSIIVHNNWKAQCSLVFHQVKATPSDLVGHSS